MKAKTKSTITTIIIILVIALIAIFALTKKLPVTNEELAKCIGSKAILYTQLGCHACEAQKELFGENYQYLNIIDCWYEGEKCGEIEYTPTWIINGKKTVGVQTVEKLKELTGC